MATPITQFITGFETGKKLVALTFDDGPNPPHTERLLGILDQKRVLASFFIVGKNAERFPELVKKIWAAGHTVGNHLYSHSLLTYLSAEKFSEELDKTQNILRSITGKHPRFYRPPWLYRTPAQLSAANARQLLAVGGTFGFEFEIFQPSAKIIASRAMQKIKPGRIIIFHDGVEGRGGDRSQTVKAVEIVIDKLLLEGFEFVTLDDIFVV